MSLQDSASTALASTNSFLKHRGLLNFRDIGKSTSENELGKRYIKEGIIFRSATLDNLDNEEVQEFIKDHHIRTILDLRTSLEGNSSAPIDKSFPTSAIDSLRSMDIMGKSQKPVIEVQKDVVVRRKYRIDFAGRNFQRYGIFMACSWRLKILLVLMIMFFQRRRAAVMVGRQVLSPMGVSNMYKRFIKHCGQEIRQALLIFTEPENYPVHIHCTQGKDRTGIVCCLLLSMAGVPEDIIVSDYAKTQAGLAPIRTEMLEDLKQSGLSEEFADAEPQNMKDLFAYVKEEYGSVENYLNDIGFGKEYQDKIRSIICA